MAHLVLAKLPWSEIGDSDFVTPVVDGTDEYDSILLEDGTRCYFNSVTPSSVP